MLLFAYLLLNNKATWIKIAIEATIGGGELQHAVVRVGYTARVGFAFMALLSLTASALRQRFS